MKKQPFAPDPNAVYTSAEVAEILCCAARTVQRAAKLHNLGTGPRLRFTAREVTELSKLIRPTPGNPNVQPGYTSGGGWPKGKKRK